jgi:hypothetical protein
MVITASHNNGVNSPRICSGNIGSTIRSSP